MAIRNLRDVAQFGSASALGAEGRKFKSSHPDMVYYLLIALVVILIISMCFSIIYARKIYAKLKESEAEIHSLNLALGYSELGMDMYKEKIDLMKLEISRINSENKLLNARIVKINNQFKNVKNYLTDN